MRQVIDETLRASVLAPWGARVHEFDLQVGEYVIPKEVCNIIRFTVNGCMLPYLCVLPLTIPS